MAYDHHHHHYPPKQDPHRNSNPWQTPVFLYTNHIHNDKQRTRLLLKALGNHEAFCPQRDCRSTGNPITVSDPMPKGPPNEASESWWNQRVFVGEEKLHHGVFVGSFLISDGPPNDGETPNCFNLTPTKTFNISQIFRLLILYARHRIISKKLATSNESAPESNESDRGHGGWFWWRETMEDVEDVSHRNSDVYQTTSWFGYISQNYRWNYTQNQNP